MIVVATEAEYKNLNIESEDVIITGVGYGNVYKALANLPRGTKILNIGYAGSNNIPIGTVCHIGECRSYHPNVKFNEAVYLLQTGDYICYSSNDFVLHTDIEESVLFDMELYAILSMGFVNVEAIKIVSDNLSLKEYEKVEQ